MPLPTKTDHADRTELEWPCGCWATIRKGSAASPLDLTHHQCPPHVVKSPTGILHEVSTCSEAGNVSGSVTDYTITWNVTTDPGNPTTATLCVETTEDNGQTYSIDFDASRAKGKNHDNMLAIFESADLG